MKLTARGLLLILFSVILMPVSLRTQPADTSWRNQGVINLDKSPYAKLHTIPVHAVTIDDGFWAQRRRVALGKSLPSARLELEANGYIDSFRRLSEGKDVPRVGPVFTDSDLYKWLEAVGFFLQSGDDPELRAEASKYIDLIHSVQEPSGYLDTYWVGDRVPERLLPATMDTGHELYCLGHMLQGSLAYYRATGDTRLLDAARKYVEFLLKNYGPDKKPLLAGHPEIEMSLIELYRTTGDHRYLDLAGYILHGDSRIERRPDRVVYTFSGIPYTDRTKMQGHAVRAMYASCGATDYYLETGDQKYWQTLNHLWTDMVSTKMYITGGLGARWMGEAFGDPYELPNSRAYAETCAAIGSLMWNWRMLSASGDAKFTDVLERQLYNAINVGMSLDGTTYCYYNPMEFSGRADPNRHSKDGSVRNPWYDVFCCPPNIERTMGALPGYFYSTSKDGLYVNLFGSSKLDWHLEDGTGIQVEQKTDYPWKGMVDFVVSPARSSEFTLYMRIPSWTSSAKLSVNGEPWKEAAKPGSYLPLRRQWSAGDRVRVEFDMTPQMIRSNPLVAENVGKVAVQRGPLVYTLEQLDQGSGNSVFDATILADGSNSANFKAEFRPNFLGGVVVLHHEGVELESPAASEALYVPLRNEARTAERKVELTFIPYYAWANRQPDAMRVWIPIKTPAGGVANGGR
jgi:uncharacterized protein